MSVTPAAPAGPEPTGASTHPNGFVGWLEEHVVPGMKEAVADADKARELIPAVQAYLPKVIALAKSDPELAEKLGPLAEEAGQILQIVESL